MSTEASHVITLNINGGLTGLSIDGEDMVYCENGRPVEKGKGVVIYSEGEDPAGADGIEIVDFNGLLCVHWYCRWWCHQSLCC